MFDALSCHLQSGWRQEARNPFTRQNTIGSNVAYPAPDAVSTSSLNEKLPTSNLVRSGISAMNMGIPPQPTSLPSLSQQILGATMGSSLHLTNTISPENLHPSLNQTLPSNSPIIQAQTSEIPLTMKNLPISNACLPNISAAAGPSVRVEHINNLKVAAMPVNASEKQPTSYSMSSLMPTQTRSHKQPQQPLVSDYRHVTPQYIPTSTSRLPMGNVGPVSDSWRASQQMASNPHYQANQNNYNASFGGGPVRQPQLLSGLPGDGNSFVGNDGFESWSPENSPTRQPEYMSRRNLQDPVTDSGLSYRPERSRQWNSSGYQEVRDHNKHGDRNWRGRRR